MLRDLLAMTSRDHVQTAILFVGPINRRPCTNGGSRLEAFSEVEFVLVPWESETNLGGLPQKSIVDAKNVRAEQIDDGIREPRVTNSL